MTSVLPLKAASLAAGPELINQRVRNMSLSPTIAMSVRAAKMRAEGRDVIGLAVGEPDFDTPEHIIAAADKAARSGFTRYTAPDGGAAVKAAVVAKFAQENSIAVTPAEVHVASGAKQVIHNAFAATLEPGDEVVIFTPAWVSYIDIVEFCGGRAVTVPTVPGRGFLPTPADLAAAITPRTRWVLINSPNNPTGAVWPAELLAELGAVLAAHPSVLVMSDEIYEHLVFDGAKHVSFLTAAPQLAGRVLTINGVSKTYAMTGWRVGYAIGPEWLIGAMAKVQSQTAGSSNAPAQAAATEALNGDQSLVPEWCAIMERRRDLAVGILTGSSRLQIARPGGAFYIYADVGRCIGARTPDGVVLADDTAVAEYVLSAGGVATVPGAAFAQEPFLRLSFALEDDRVAEACHRIVSALDALKSADGGEK